MRVDVETLMGVLGCSAAHAVIIMQLNTLNTLISPEDAEDWGPGANPPEEV